jgi:hypothetical protein
MIHLLLSALPEDAQIPEGLLPPVMLQFQVTGLMLAVAFLYVSFAFYFYTDPYNPRFLGIAGIIMVGFMSSVALLYGIWGTVNVTVPYIISSLWTRDDENPTPTFSLREMGQETEGPIMRNETSCRLSRYLKVVFRAYFQLMQSLSIFQPRSKRNTSPYGIIFRFILVEIFALYFFLILSCAELWLSSKTCVHPNP